MESVAKHKKTQKSKKRLLMDPDVVEIPPPVNRSSTSKSTNMKMDSSRSQNYATDLGVQSDASSGLEIHVNEDKNLTKFQLFKKFDIVEDPSDHHFVGSRSSATLPSKSWSKKIQEEWKILENDLPDTIFVRVYGSRMDLLRAVIVGAQGTPYHDGLFFFDVMFPKNYPDVPPHVHYHAHGVRLNPNLYQCGNVCLSLLNTWSGSGNEKWVSKESTILQVLVSVQGLVLNAKPYFNEPGYEGTIGTLYGEKMSEEYSERTFILSLKTMVYTLKSPPKHFEEFVVGHFSKHGQDIQVACKAYLDGAQVGCLVSGGVQDVDEGDKSCSQKFKSELGEYMKTLISAFEKIGTEGSEQFTPPAQERPVGKKVAAFANKVVIFFT